MQRFKLSDNTVVLPGQGFVFAGVRYGSNWYAEMNDAQKAEIGLTEIVMDPRPDDRFYFVSEDPANLGKWQALPKPLDGLRAMLKQGVQDYVRSNLAQTDWVITREAEGYKAAPSSIVEFRKALRDQGNALITEITALGDFDAVTAWRPHDWPEQA